MDLDTMRAPLADRRVWGGLGLVWKPPQHDKHYEFYDNDVLVYVRMQPTDDEIICRLVSANGLWVIPPLGSEVAVLVPMGDYEAEPMIVGILSTEGVPDALSSDEEKHMVVVNPNGAKILLADSDHKPVARVGDEIDLGTFTFVPGAGVAKLSWLPPGGSGEAAEITAATNLIGKVKSGSDKVESG